MAENKQNDKQNNLQNNYDMILIKRWLMMREEITNNKKRSFLNTKWKKWKINYKHFNKAQNNIYYDALHKNTTCN